MGLFEIHIHSRLVVYPLMPRADMRVALCLSVVAGNPERSFSASMFGPDSLVDLGQKKEAQSFVLPDILFTKPA